MNKFTILIQGIPNNTSKQTIVNYLKYGDVVISCYTNDYTDDIVDLPNLKIVKSDLPNLNGYYNNVNTFLQTYTTYMGLKECKSDFTIKVRSDESYPNLDNFIKNIIENPDKVHVTNLYTFKSDKCKSCRFHIGNHIFASRTHLMLRSMEWGINACDISKMDKYGVEMTDYIIPGGMNPILISDANSTKIEAWAEVFTTICFIKGLCVDLDYNNYKEILVNNFYLTPLHDFPGYKWTNSMNNKKPISVEDGTNFPFECPWQNNNYINKIEEI
jgi:hypothetical protein